MNILNKQESALGILRYKTKRKLKKKKEISVTVFIMS